MGRDLYTTIQALNEHVSQDTVGLLYAQFVANNSSGKSPGFLLTKDRSKNVPALIEGAKKTFVRLGRSSLMETYSSLFCKLVDEQKILQGDFDFGERVYAQGSVEDTIKRLSDEARYDDIGKAIAIGSKRYFEEAVSHGKVGSYHLTKEYDHIQEALLEVLLNE